MLVDEWKLEGSTSGLCQLHAFREKLISLDHVLIMALLNELLVRAIVVWKQCIFLEVEECIHVIFTLPHRLLIFRSYFLIFEVNGFIS